MVQAKEEDLVQYVLPQAVETARHYKMEINVDHNNENIRTRKINANHRGKPTTRKCTNSNTKKSSGKWSLTAPRELEITHSVGQEKIALNKQFELIVEGKANTMYIFSIALYGSGT